MSKSTASVPKVAVIGCGAWGRNLVRVFHTLGALKAVCEPSQAGRETCRSIAPAVPVKETLDPILKDRRIEAVAIATPAATHAEIAEKAILAGKHVFVEKPLALSVAIGEQLRDLALKAKRCVMVGHLLNYHPAVERLKQLIDAGELGEIQYIHSNRLNFGKLRREENILWSFAPHDISVILMLLDETPGEVRCFGGDYIRRGVSDVTLTMLDFSGGVKAHIFVSWMHPYKEQKLVVVGSRQMAVFDDMASDKLLLYPHTIEWPHRSPVALKTNPRVVPLDAVEPLRKECAHFLSCLRNGQKPFTDLEEGLRVLRVLSASEESLKQNGKPVAMAGSASYFLHPSSVTDEAVQIGAGSKIWHFSHILRNTTIGKNCVIGQNVMAGPDVVIGDNVKIQNNVSVYKGVTLQSDVFCGPSVVFTNVVNPRSRISRKNEFRNTLVKRGATLGANSTIIAGVTIGCHAFVGAGAVVTKDIPDHALVTGVPARISGWMCECGVKLTFSRKRSQCDACGKKYEKESRRVIRI